MQFFNHFQQAFGYFRRKLQAARGGYFARFFRHDADGKRLIFQRGFFQLRRVGTFQMDFARKRFAQPGHVFLVNMTLVFAQMDDDVIRPGAQAHGRGVHRVRVGRAARLAQRGDMVYVYP